MQRVVPVLLLTLLLGVGLPGPSVASPASTSSFEDFEKAVDAALSSEDPAVRARAFEVLHACGDVRAVDLIVKSVDRILKDQDRIRRDQKKIESSYEAEFSKKVKLDEWFENSRGSSRELDRYNEGVRKIRKDMDQLRLDLRNLENDYTRTQAQLDSAVRAMGKVLSNLGTEGLNQGLATIGAKWLESRDADDKMRWLDALAELDRPTVTDRIRDLLNRADVAIEIRAAALETLGARKDPSALDVAIRCLEAGVDQWDMTAAAIRVLQLLHDRRGIEPLIAFLAREDLKRLREDAHAALKSLTGQQHGPYHDPWKRWWDDEKDRFTMPPEPAGAVDEDAPPEGATFYGIHTFSDRILFILDSSGSMDQAPKAEPGQPPPSPKIDVARKELIGFIESLNDGDRFNVIFFNHEVVPWQTKMLEASNATKRRARTFIEKTEPRGGTNIYDALEAGFAIALEATGEPVVDTIFFLTDGRPTAGKIQEPERILADVAEWNRTARLTIHCVGVGDHDEAFMRALATLGAGKYVKR